jgi:hypothetical protein
MRLCIYFSTLLSLLISVRWLNDREIFQFCSFALASSKVLGLSIKHKTHTPTVVSFIISPLCQVIQFSGYWCDRFIHLCVHVIFFKLLEICQWSFGKFNVGFCRSYLRFIFLARQHSPGISFNISLSSAFTHTTTEQPKDFHKIWHFPYFRNVFFIVLTFLQLAQLSNDHWAGRFICVSARAYPW